MNFKQKQQMEKAKAEELKRIKKLYETPLPSQIQAKIETEWHIATEPAYEILTLEEYGERQFIISYNEFEHLKMEEGKQYLFNIELCESFEEAGIDHPVYTIKSANEL